MVAYKDRQRELIRAVLEELEVLTGVGLEKDTERVSCGRCRWTTALAPAQQYLLMVQYL